MKHQIIGGESVKAKASLAKLVKSLTLMATGGLTGVKSLPPSQVRGFRVRFKNSLGLHVFRAESIEG
ncbi:hypothetical protein DRO53_03225 [Candidatus Bathyarchaeota archaeon]|nr:MAG: hypothetical protein DRO46_00610 [Candidatus Hecatellales archaeon]RLI34591.1 MAG: hypothetical protein DRO53_03225 [Candidatus Bathyarchaeota archaeon]